MVAAGSSGAGGIGGAAIVSAGAGGAGDGLGAAGSADEPGPGVAGGPMAPVEDERPQQGQQAPAEPICDAVTEVFQVSCASRGGCHNAIGVGNFALGQAQAAAYVGQPPVFNVSRCGLMIDPQNVEQSMILTKVTLQPPYTADCGLPMPSNGTVTPDQIECIRSWLQQFAQ